MKKYSYFILLASATLWSCGESKKEQKSEQKTTEAKPDTVKVFSLKADKVEKTITLPGELLPFEKVQIHAKVAGYIRQIKVDIGSFVKKGQILATIDAPEVKAKLAEAGGKYQVTKAKLKASGDIYKRLFIASKTQGVVAENELEKARNQVFADSAEVQAVGFSVNALKDVENYLVIYAPFDGVVTKRNADAGAYVGTPNEKPMLEIENNRVLRLRVAVPEAIASSNLKDNIIQFATKGVPNQKFEANLMRKSGSIDASTRSEIWEFEVKNPNRILKAGMYADVKLAISRSQNSFLVPFSAIVTTLEKKFVIKVSNGITQWIDVQQGLNLPEKAEIFGGITEGDTLILKGNEELKSDTKVIVKFEVKKD